MKIFKRTMSFLLVCCMFFVNGNIVFAKEVSQENEMSTVEENKINSNENLNDLSLANVGRSVTVPAKGYADLYFDLDSYVGFNKTLTVNASTEGESTLLLLYLYDPNGNLKSNDWIMGSNELVEWSLFLPTSGQWRLRIIASASNTPVRVFAKWN